MTIISESTHNGIICYLSSHRPAESLSDRLSVGRALKKKCVKAPIMEPYGIIVSTSLRHVCLVDFLQNSLGLNLYTYFLSKIPRLDKI